MTEVLISLVVFAPLFLMVPILGKYLDIKNSNMAASRYAVWERSVWSDESASWNDGENHKTDAQIQQEMTARFLTDPLEPIRSGAQTASTENGLWTSHEPEQLVEPGSTTAVEENRGPLPLPVVDNLAHEGVPGGGAIAGIGSSIPVPGGCGRLGEGLDTGLDLGAEGYVTATAQTTLRNIMVDSSYFELDTEVGPNINMESGAALLTNTWLAPDEQKFKDRTYNIVLDEVVDCVESFGRLTLGLMTLPTDRNGILFGEVNRSDPVDTAVDSTVILDEYKK